MISLDSSFVLAAFLLISALVFRIMIYKAASASSVDAHYWILASNAYREQRSLPVIIPNKYILESEIQAYPPLFGILLGRVLPKYLIPYGTLIIEAIEICILVLTMQFLKFSAEGIFLAIAFYISAPLVVVYNSQLTPRALGDLFLSCALALQVLAGMDYVHGYQALFFWLLSSLMISFMLMSHKMTYQLYIVLLPFFVISLNTFNVLYAGLLGLAIYIALVGLGFFKIQLKAHLEIISFWGRHWPNLGAHQFKNSPLYGEVNVDRFGFFHQPGLRGVVKHLRVVIAYAPISIVLPLCSFVSGVWPPDWLLVWLGVTYAWIFLTLFNSYFKRFGGGHLYVFNAIIPAIIYIGYLPIDQKAVVNLLVFAGVMTLIALYFGWRIVSRRSMIRDSDFDELIDHIRLWPPSRFAVFPLQSAESVAEKTPHAVLWGGHGLGFDQLEGFFPILTRLLTEFIHEKKIEWILWDSAYWPNGENVMDLEGLIDKYKIIKFRRWCLAEVIGEIY